ncbi:TetR/AcrR family transcriptional regulator [Sporosarcina sp. FSL K6-3457]|uniref:TetR/AcrR family transcriptional regulator n=1 Tax=Sporosarcina sp. FSL K6-3457 TaxID=2978204 RepID=UPI0030F93C2C
MILLESSNRQIRKKQLTIESLKNAFINLILENNSVELITIGEITNRADFNRGTFYIHYKDKIDLLEALYQDAIEGLHQALMLPYKGIDKVILNGVVPSTTLIFEHIEKNKKLFKALDLIRKNPDLYNRLEQMFWNLFTTEIQFERESESEFETEYEIFLSYQIHATLGVLKFWIKKDFNYSSKFMSEQLTSFYSEKVIAMHYKEHTF